MKLPMCLILLLTDYKCFQIWKLSNLTFPKQEASIQGNSILYYLESRNQSLFIAEGLFFSEHFFFLIPGKLFLAMICLRKEMLLALVLLLFSSMLF